MKLRKLTLISAIAFGMFACGGESKDQAADSVENTEVSNESVEESTYKVDVENSVVAWKGEVAGVYGHNGVIAIKEGTLDLSGESLIGGTIIIDMNTIEPLDEAYKDEDGHRKEDLVGHLSNDDFFLVETYPTATFVIKSMADNKIVGDLTIRDKTKEETVDVSEFTVSESGVSGKGTLVFNRQDYDVAWVHFMKDMVLSDNISLELNISATK